MNIIKTLPVIIGVTLSLLLVAPVIADHPSNLDANDKVTFKLVMQGLLVNTKNITQGIILEDYALIEEAAKGIIKHPKPAMSQRRKLMKALAEDVSSFKSYDHVVHGGAAKIVQAAKDKNIDLVLSEYQKLIIGCQSCHNTFKARLSKALQ